MRLFEAIIDANHRALSGDESAGLRPDDYADSLPIIALTCIDPRLNPLMPEVLGIPEDKFIWLRNAGNIITSSTSSTMRSLALACLVKGGREIAILGHTDCLVGRTSIMQLTDRLRALGLDRSKLPENLTEYFGVFGSERQNVLKAVEFVRSSPLIGTGIPVHGLVVDIRSGKLEWLVNGYDTFGRPAVAALETPLQQVGDWLKSAPFKLGDLQFSETKIGEFAGKVGDTAEQIGSLAARADRLAEKIEASPLGHTRAGGMASMVERAAEQIGAAASQVGQWVEQHKPAEKKPVPTPPPVPRPMHPRQPPPAPPTSHGGTPKPIPLPPRISGPPRPPQRNRDE